MGVGLPLSVARDLVEKIQSLKQDLMNMSMEARLSIELETKDYKEMNAKLSTTIQTLVEKYQQLNALYLQECEKRRKVSVLALNEVGIGLPM